MRGRLLCVKAMGGGWCWPFVPTLIPTTSVPSLLYHPTFSGAKIVVSGEVMSSNAFIMRPMKFTLPALSGPLGDRKRGIGMTLDWYFELCSSTFFFRYLLHWDHGCVHLCVRARRSCWRGQE